MNGRVVVTGNGWGRVLVGAGLLALGAVVGVVLRRRARRSEARVGAALIAQAERRHAASEGTLSLDQLKAYLWGRGRSRC